MGKFDLDDLLNDLGEPDENAPKEPSPKPKKKGRFARQRTDEVPGPPDPSGAGLGEEIEATALEDADPARAKPQDGTSELYKPQDNAPLVSTKDLGEYLLLKDEITPEQLATIKRVQKQNPGKRIAESLIELGADEIIVQEAVAKIARLKFERIDAEAEDAYDEQALQKLTPEFCRSNLVMPLRKEGSRMVVGTASPDDVFLLDEVKRRLGVAAVKHVLVTASDIGGIIEVETGGASEDYDINEILADADDDDVELVKKDKDEYDDAEAESSPVVRYVNHIIQTALKEGASDIHIEPEEKSLKVRFRIDGILFEMMNPPRKMHAALTSRIKIMANLDIAERRLPQDGRIRVNVMGRTLDLRVSTVPTAKGEKTVMRILDNRAISVSLDELGFVDETLIIWKNQIKQPHGIILVTGPTGSGKTTTLYASIQQLDLPKLNVSTVEDPVEYNLNGITQIQTHERIGMTFSVALRALLRQDPDVVMLGEIRDMETASIAIQASMTGHLVLSTLHTNDAPSSITRLINIGIEPFLVAAAVNSVLAQRLVRRICPHCEQQIEVTEEIGEFLAVHGISASKVKHGTGCAKCRETGYSGRNGLYELLRLDDHLRDQIARNPNVTEFRRQCTARGMVTLREDGLKKVARGLTTVEEILRVTEATI